MDVLFFSCFTYKPKPVFDTAAYLAGAGAAGVEAGAVGAEAGAAGIEAGVF